MLFAISGLPARETRIVRLILTELPLPPLGLPPLPPFPRTLAAPMHDVKNGFVLTSYSLDLEPVLTPSSLDSEPQGAAPSAP